MLDQYFTNQAPAPAVASSFGAQLTDALSSTEDRPRTFYLTKPKSKA